MTHTASPHTPHQATPVASLSDSAVDLAGHTVRVRVHGTPKDKRARPLVLHFHGGQFTGGRADDGDALAMLLADLGALVASVDYPLAPAHPFPAAVDVGHAALGWLQALAGRRTQPVLLVGEEAGGNVAAAVATMARDRDPDQVAAQLLVSPLLDPCMASASSRAASVGVGGCSIGCGWKEYLSRPADIAHPYAAPAAAVRLGGLAPLLLVSFAGSPLQDEGRRYVDRLQAAGVPADELELPREAWRAVPTWPPEAVDRVRAFVAAHAGVPVTPR